MMMMRYWQSKNSTTAVVESCRYPARAIKHTAKLLGSAIQTRSSRYPPPRIAYLQSSKSIVTATYSRLYVLNRLTLSHVKVGARICSYPEGRPYMQRMKTRYFGLI